MQNPRQVFNLLFGKDKMKLCERGLVLVGGTIVILQLEMRSHAAFRQDDGGVRTVGAGIYLGKSI
jgi:hypothetical protein